MARIAKWKTEKVEELTSLLVGSPVIAVANIKGIPAPQLQVMRRKLRQKARVVVSKNNLFSRAFSKAASNKKGIEKLVEAIEGQTAILCADMNPFVLYRMVKSAQTQAPARGGEIAPYDILIRAGETSFKPGPIMSDLQRVGLPAAIEGGKIIIRKDKVLVKKGDPIPRDVAIVLSRMNIHPITVGMRIRAAYEDGMILGSDVLDIDQEAFVEELRSCGRKAFNLAMFVNYPCKQTIVPLLSKAVREAFNLEMNAMIFSKRTVTEFLRKAIIQMLSLASRIPDALDEELRQVMQKEEEKREEEMIKGLSSLL